MKNDEKIRIELNTIQYFQACQIVKRLNCQVKYQMEEVSCMKNVKRAKLFVI